MKRNFKGLFALAMAACVLTGCSKEEEAPESIIIVDAGGVGVNGSLMPASMQQSSSAPDIASQPASSVNSGAQSSSKQSSSTKTSSSSRQSSSTKTSSSSKPVSSTAGSSTSSYIAKPLQSAEVSSNHNMTPVEGSRVSSNPSSSVTSSGSGSVSKPVSSSTSKPAVNPGVNNYKPLNYSEVKGVWISYLEIMNMPSNSASEFRKAVAATYDNCVDLGINTVYVHARSHGDAYYDSELFPYTKYLSGGFDALEIMIDEAHKRNLSFQAWINPLRMCEAKDADRAKGYLLGDWIKDGKRAVKVGDYYYLNPAYDEVIKLIADGAAEIVKNYDVDGLHIDDYFYPTTDASFDSAEFKASSYNKLSDFRFNNCDKFVKKLYSTVKSCNPDALFGISCQGNLQNNYDYMYADIKKWCANPGYTDYIMPQIYFGFNNATQPFEQCCKTWDNLAKSGNIPLIVGITASKIGFEDSWAGASGKREWITDKEILSRQVLESMEQQSYGGVCLFSYKNIFTPANSVKTQVNAEVTALKKVLK